MLHYYGYEVEEAGSGARFGACFWYLFDFLHDPVFYSRFYSSVVLPDLSVLSNAGLDVAVEPPVDASDVAFFPVCDEFGGCGYYMGCEFVCITGWCPFDEVCHLGEQALKRYEVAERFSGVFQDAGEGFVSSAVAIPAWADDYGDDLGRVSMGEQGMLVRPSLD